MEPQIVILRFKNYQNFQIAPKSSKFLPISAAFSTNQGPAVSDPDTVWFLRSFFHFLKRSNDPILRLLNNFKPFLNFENFKKFGNSDLEILIFQSMFLYHVMIQMYSPSVANNGQYNSNHILKCNFISFLFNYIADFISHNYQGPADFTVPARVSPSAHPESIERALNPGL